jgi:hypothetical protein
MMTDAVPTPHEQVGDRIDPEDEATQQPLDLARQRRWVEYRHDVLVNEGRGVARGSALLAKPVFERRQRANPASELDPRTPDDGWKVHPRKPRPANDEQPPNDDEQHERKVEDDDGVRQKAK